jgi:hypothetical protein
MVHDSPILSTIDAPTANPPMAPTMATFEIHPALAPLTLVGKSSDR